MTDRVTDVNYVRDALCERLPAGFSLQRDEQNGHALYRWTDWRAGLQCVVQVEEQYAHAMGTVDALCDQLMVAVLDSFAATRSNLSPISQRRLHNGNV